MEYLSGQNEIGANKTKTFRDNKGICLVPERIKIMWEEQLVDPPIDWQHVTNLNIFIAHLGIFKAEFV